MPTPPRRALVVIDVQEEYVSGKLLIEHPPVAQSLAAIARAIDAAHAAGVPVFAVQHTEAPGASLFAEGSPGWALHEVVASRPHDRLIRKSAPSVFSGTGLADALAAARIDTLAVAGYMTHNCNASTIFEAAHRGFAVEFLADASGALSYANAAGRAGAEEIQRVFSVVFHSRFAAVTSTADWIAAVRDGRSIERDSIPASNARTRAA